jgi:hypothetical protein
LTTWLVVKFLTTAGVVVLVSEIARRSDRLGGLVAALPLTTLLALSWMWFEGQPADRLANHAWYTFWYVVPTMPMFLVFPSLLPRVGFWPTMVLCAVLTVVLFAGFAVLMRRWGVDLWP